MAITYPLDLPTNPGIRNMVWDLDSAVGVDENPYDFSQTVYAWSGKLRKVTIELPKMTMADAKKWQSWAMKLNGREGAFYLKDASYARAPNGNVLDNYVGAQVDGADQNTGTLATKGWAPSVTDLFKEGDWISIGDRLYSVLEDVSSDGFGDASLTIWPFAANYADETAIAVGSSAKGKFRLMDWPGWTLDFTRLMSGFTFTAREVVS